jgi:hypothetical protein
VYPIFQASVDICVDPSKNYNQLRFTSSHVFFIYHHTNGELGRALVIAILFNTGQLGRKETYKLEANPKKLHKKQTSPMLGKLV